MSAHTPGPWHFLDWGGRIVDDSVGSSQVLIATVALNTRGDESRHNARLIAAAPELLEACKALLNYAENTESELGITLGSAEKARAAIEKATQP